MWRVLFFVLFCCFCFALESKVDSTKNIESKSQDSIKITESNNKISNITQNLDSINYKQNQDSMKMTESNMKVSTNITESASKDSISTQDSTNMTKNITESNKTDAEKLQDSINVTESKNQNTESKKDSIQFNPKSKTPRFPLLDKKEKNKLLHTDYADSPKVFAAPKPLEHLSMSPFEEWRGSYVMYMYNFSPMDNPLYRRDEMKFQLSFRVPLVRDIFRSGGVLYFAFTDTFFFQVFNDAASSPVRDNDFQPEILYTYPMNVEFWGGALSELTTGYRHISNGEIDTTQGNAIDKSRGSDRWIFKAIWQSKHFGIDWESFFPIRYYPENPDIYRYLGGADLKFYLRYGRHLADITLNGLLSKKNLKGHGGIRLSYTYKLNAFVGLYAQYFVGFGDYLWEYNRFGHRFGVGLRFVR